MRLEGLINLIQKNNKNMLPFMKVVCCQHNACCLDQCFGWIKLLSVAGISEQKFCSDPNDSVISKHNGLMHWLNVQLFYAAQNVKTTLILTSIVSHERKLLPAEPSHKLQKLDLSFLFYWSKSTTSPVLFSILAITIY